jgi:hypothetical protein
VSSVSYEHHLHVTNKAILVAGRENQYGFETSRIPHSLDSGSKMALRLSTSRSVRRCTSHNRFSICVSVISVIGSVSPQELVRPEGLITLIKIFRPIVYRTSDLPDFSA